MRALVIGADGFAGRWLTRHLSEFGDVVIAGTGPRYTPPMPFADEVEVTDVRDPLAVDHLVELSRPDVTYYLAGVSQRGKREALRSAAGVNVTGSLNVMLSLAQHAPGSTLLFVSSGYVYEPSDRPHDEDGATKPIEAYGASKLAAEESLRQLASVADMDVVVARPFNHIGPGQRKGFLVPTVASQLRDVAEGRTDEIVVGATTDIRDFTDVRDVVRGYRLIATTGQAGAVYNVASGEGRAIADVIGMMIRLAGVDARVTSKPLLDSVGPTALIGDPSRLRQLGWFCEVSLEESLRDALAEHMGTLIGDQ